MSWSGETAPSRWPCSGSARDCRETFLALEQEVKLKFDTIEAARHAIHIAGGRLVASRRLIDDQLYDRDVAPLQTSGCTLRIRRDGDQGILTFKGPGREGPVKSREEIETTVGSATALESIVAALGFRPFFRAQKYREEFEIGAAPSQARLTIDETPMGVFVEIEATPDTIAVTTAALGRSSTDYILESYQRLYAAWASTHGGSPQAMLV